MHPSKQHPPFYGKKIFRKSEQEYIKNILKKYKKEPVDDLLKQKIYEELMREKHLENITIPFKVVLRKDPFRIHPDYIEIIIDSKV